MKSLIALFVLFFVFVAAIFLFPPLVEFVGVIKWVLFVFSAIICILFFALIFDLNDVVRKSEDFKVKVEALVEVAGGARFLNQVLWHQRAVVASMGRRFNRGLSLEQYDEDRIFNLGRELGYTPTPPYKES